MGYSTEFRGELKFTNELTAKELAHIKKYLGEDVRDHADWKNHNMDGAYFIDLEFLDDFSGIQWNGNEKSGGMVEAVNFITKEMRIIKPNFSFTGSFMCQGEEIDDRWKLVIGKTGVATEKRIVIKGEKVTCPNCDETFILEGE